MSNRGSNFIPYLGVIVGALLLLWLSAILIFGDGSTP